MWLINAGTLNLERVDHEGVEKYAILSHRWLEPSQDEVSFQDMQDLAVASKKKGYAKIQKSCEQAKKHDLHYIWVDTCCINKESSSEFSEAINSMFRWYKASAICYAFLADVHANPLNSDTMKQQMKDSVWFTRGWTLQELIAPDTVVFYNQQWRVLGSKQTLSKLLNSRTGIDEAILREGLRGAPLNGYSIAQRMSWAAGRKTKRDEDEAYCLLGIFEVNMPMLYGEGKNAFLRLQEQIVKQSDDHTIFAWPMHRNSQPGLLADSPDAFANCQYVKPMTSRTGRSSYSLTNRGLSIKLMATHFTVDTYLVRLDCVDPLTPADDGTIDECRLGMFLRRLNEDDQFARVKHEGETFMQVKATLWDQKATRPVELIEINVKQQLDRLNTKDYKDRVNGFRIATPGLLEQSSKGKDQFQISRSIWNPEERILSMRAGQFGTVGVLDISQQDRKIKVIKLGFDFQYNPVCFIATSKGLEEKTEIMDRSGNYFNLGLERQEAMWTKEEQLERKGIHQRSPFDTMAWSDVRGRYASELRQHSGLWALKADRINGLDVRLGDTADLQIVRGELRDKLVWDVYLDNVKDSTLRGLTSRFK